MKNKNSPIRNIEFKVPSLDLHGVIHSEVHLILENYVLCRQAYLPLKIITGNSEKMKKLVVDFLNNYKFKFIMGDKFNKGFIVVLK